MMKSIFALTLILPFVGPFAIAQEAPQNLAARPLLTIQTLPWRETKWRTVPVRTLEDLPGYSVQNVDKGLSRYGGLSSKKMTATGFFHAQKAANRWWLVDPDGYAYINRGVNAVGAGDAAAMTKKFGTKEAWATQTVQLLRQNGFNSSACWSDDAALAATPARLPYAPRWNFMGTYKQERRKWSLTPPGKSVYPGDAIFVFDAEFPAFCDRHARQIAASKDDPFLIGHFSDNELPFAKNSLDNFLTLAPEDPGYIAALQWLREKHGPNASAKDISDDDRQKFLALVGEKYFSVVSQAIKKYDPNHLYLGTRFHSNVMDQPLFMQTAGHYLDVVSINYYGQWTPRPERMENWAKNSGKPFLITEFYAKGADTGMGNATGAGWVVNTQRERGLFYEQFALGLLENRNCVGWHWFQYMDPGAAGDPAVSNKGIVNTHYEPYLPLTDAMKRVNERAYGLADYFDRQTQPTQP